MTKFEIYGDSKVIYTDGTDGAFLNVITGKWHPFTFFNDGKLDFDDIGIDTPNDAYKKAKELYT